ncbi:methionine biosynthesis protein MetW [Tessaracoccus bendigoensis DSM 12906]|uniref:Methionine biosynthesis protein MetW n=1 Tax=Tessaracoccus bendigoensis DSM 12906 TaxID=1123357 RepID=A0A1M6GSB0_9ACTN|nr:methionine biosynthesis protein MetW [Tessaracoccus bendigoensis]SHJ12875.1 methionine biosynthesis protein MetW [Tessaracoccus bendigoensis DSM 12906]
MTERFRADLAIIADLIPEGSRVLDLGCGNGDLLRLLSEKGCTGTGVDVDPSNVLACLRHGVNVIDLDLDTQLGEFGDDSYDFVVLSRTLQTVYKPRRVLSEMGRIAVHSLVSMPNFAHWRNRLRLLRGRMPMSKDLPFEWYDTPNLHHSSIPDLEPLFASLDMVIDRRIPLDADGHRHRAGNIGANLLASSVLFMLHAARP